MSISTAYNTKYNDYTERDGFTVGDSVTYEGKDWAIVRIFNFLSDNIPATPPPIYARLKSARGYFREVEIGALFGIPRESIRRCSECGRPMKAGYVIDDGDELYCSDACLHKHYSDEDYQRMYANTLDEEDELCQGHDDSVGEGYYTKWESYDEEEA